MALFDLPQSSWPQLLQFVCDTLRKERYSDPKNLTRFGNKAYSQCDEDGIVAEIFKRIGIANATFIEIGVDVGLECNSLWLLFQGWRGAWIEANPEFTNTVERSHKHWISSRHLKLLQAFVTAENINSLILATELRNEIDFLSIDIDNNDYWVWNALSAVSPRVVCIEYNATWSPPVAIVVKYRADASWSRSNCFGASLCMLNKLAESKGYSLVGCSLGGGNAFFERKDLVGDLFYRPGSVADHYESAKYFLADLPSGHPSGVGETVLL